MSERALIRHVSKSAAALVALILPVPVVVRNIMMTTALEHPAECALLLECFVTLGDNPAYAHGLICRGTTRLCSLTSWAI